MNAICGFALRDRERSAIPSTLQRMAATMPVDARVGQLRTLDLSSAGLASYEQSPAAITAAGSWLREPDLALVCASELYNAAALRQQLGDSIDREAGEAAIIAGLYRRHELACVRHLRGAFSFALWDERRQRLLLATDPFGIQPLHYSCGVHGLAFASRIKPLLQDPETSRQIDLDAVLHYFFYGCIPTPHTIYGAIKKLPPGHLLSFSNGGVRLERYWDVSYDEDRPVDGTAIPEYLAAAVRSQATYEGRVDRIGAFLSGGTDSSAISGLLGDVLAQPAKTFSIGFAEEEFNEIAFARVAARHFRTAHYEHFVTPADTVALLPRLVRAYDEPFGNASAVAAYYCAALAREHGVETLLAGDGGDELFGGNTRYVRSQVFELYHALPHWFRQHLFEPLLYGLPLPSRGIIDKGRKYVRRANLPQPRRFFSYNLLYTVAPETMFTDAFLAAVQCDGPLALANEHYQRLATASPLNRLLYVDLKIAITDNDLRKVTRMCELAGVRVRYPMLDLNLVEYSGRIPAALKVRRLRERYAFKKAFEHFLPAEILAKPKHGFGLPVSRWLRSPPLLELARDTLLSRRALQRGYLRPAFLECMFELHREDSTNFYGDNLWTFLMLELWHQAQD